MKKFDPIHFGKVAVLMGGEHSEREISLMSGNAVLEALLHEGVDAYSVDVGPNIAEDLMKGKYDRAFVALHGTQGEDGTIQGLLECLNIPYTGSGVSASAIAMDKPKTKLIWKALGLPTLPFIIIDRNTDFEVVVKKLGLPLVIKPTSEGSSVGVFRVDTHDEFLNAMDDATTRTRKIMAEPWIKGIDGDEYSVSILKDEALPATRIRAIEGFYDYDAKYFSDETGYFVPSGLSQEDEFLIQNFALKAYRALDCRHWGRVDLLRDSTGKFWLMEMNTIPGLTSHSLVPMAAKAVGISFDELVIQILGETF